MSSAGTGDFEKAHREPNERSLGGLVGRMKGRFLADLCSFETAPLSNCEDMVRRWIHGSDLEAGNWRQSNRKGYRDAAAVREDNVQLLSAIQRDLGRLGGEAFALAITTRFLEDSEVLAAGRRGPEVDQS